MNREDIIRIALEVGLEQDGDNFFSSKSDPQVDVQIADLEAFANLVASVEREACAKVADNFAMTSQYKTQRSLAEWCASSIRAREQA